MREPARIEAAIELLASIGKGRTPMDNMIRDYMAARRYIGSKDRTAIVERVYRITRSHARLGWWLAQNGMEEAARNRVLADLVFHARMDAAALEQIFTGEKHAPGLLSEKERGFIQALQGKMMTDPSMPDSVRGECPQWAEERLRGLWGGAFESHLAAMIEPAPVDLRVNTIKGTVEEAIESLAADKIKAAQSAYSPVGLRTHGRPFLGDSKAFRSGLVEIQDEGSQLIALVSGAKPGHRVLDFCAGGGGKTLALAAMMENRGNIVATDNDTRRLEKGKPRYRKAGVHNVELRSLADEKNRKWLRRQKDAMDVVVVDAPCSSSGTWRRNPDLRWAWYGPALEEIIAMQSAILDKVADKVKPGGRLVYATCSLFREENEEQVEAFLQRHPDYKILPLSGLWEDMGTPVPCEGDFLCLNPRDHGTDGFFAAILQRA
ncbi:MAG: RsmB/NOP family class I SAM-dependent RNA methyltransferase [Micavibrio sp.]